MARFVGLPDVPIGVDAWQAQILDGLKQNVELLTGGRGEADRASQAITKGDLELRPLPESTVSLSARLTAQGAGFEIEGQKLVSLDDYAKLLNDFNQLLADFQSLAVEVEQLNRYVNILVQQLKR